MTKPRVPWIKAPPALRSHGCGSGLYNLMRPQSALCDRTPEQFARRWRPERSEDSARTAGPAHRLPAGAVQGVSPSVQESEPISVPPSAMKGGAEKQPLGPGAASFQNEQVARGCESSPWGAIKAGITGTNRPHQAKISTRRSVYFCGAGRCAQTLTSESEINRSEATPSMLAAYVSFALS
jgi:hypothetical protein